MEKFKACEKEMKTKAFSKEGLIQSAKLDPKQQEKMETTHWLQTQVEELQMQVEQAEAEIETLQGGVKKKNRGGQAAERLELLERLNERRKWHISRLELILRLLDNGSLSTEKANALKEDVSYFVESNMVRRDTIISQSNMPTRLCAVCRKRTSTKMRASTMTSTLTKRKRSLASLTMRTATIPKRQVMVCIPFTNVFCSF